MRSPRATRWHWRKVFAKWAGENAEFQFKLGIVDGKLLNVEEVKALATLPSKDEIAIAKLLLPHQMLRRSALVTVMNATGRDLAVVINQGVEKEKFAAGIKGQLLVISRLVGFS